MIGWLLPPDACFRLALMNACIQHSSRKQSSPSHGGQSIIVRRKSPPEKKPPDGRKKVSTKTVEQIQNRGQSPRVKKLWRKHQWEMVDLGGFACAYVGDFVS